MENTLTFQKEHVFIVSMIEGIIDSSGGMGYISNAISSFLSLGIK
jgi:hypothetical protein